MASIKVGTRSTADTTCWASTVAGLIRLGQTTRFTMPFNVTGQPAISLPLQWNDAGLPIGIQLVAAVGREDLLFQVSGQLESARPWAAKLPGTHA